MADSEALTRRLRHLLRCRVEGGSPASYRLFTEQLTPLGNVLAQVGLGVIRTRVGTGGDLYLVRLLKKVILAQFQLLFLSKELREDVRYAFGVCCGLSAMVESFNRSVSSSCSSPATYHHYRLPPSSLFFDKIGTCELELCFADISEVVLTLHAEQVATDILGLPAPRPESFLQLARFETSFLRAFLGVFATFTTLLGHHKGAFVSEEAFSLAAEGGQVEKITWLDCLIPGAQSEVLKKTEHVLLAGLWNRVSLKLIADHFLSDSQRAADFVALLRRAAEHEGE